MVQIVVHLWSIVVNCGKCLLFIMNGHILLPNDGRPWRFIKDTVISKGHNLNFKCTRVIH